MIIDYVHAINSILRSLRLDLIYLFKKEKINEYDELRNEIYDKLELWRNGITKENITVMLDYTLCVGKFASYDIFVKDLTMVRVKELDKIKNYEYWTVEHWSQGLKLGTSSRRVESQTTRVKELKCD